MLYAFRPADLTARYLVSQDILYNDADLIVELMLLTDVCMFIVIYLNMGKKMSTCLNIAKILCDESEGPFLIRKTKYIVSKTPRCVAMFVNRATPELADDNFN